MLLYFCLQTNKQCCHLLSLTNHSSAFWPVFGLKLSMFYLAPVSGSRKIWHQKDMTDWPVSGTSWLVPETGARNWPVCHHYYVCLSCLSVWYLCLSFIVQVLCYILDRNVCLLPSYFAVNEITKLFADDRPAPHWVCVYFCHLVCSGSFFILFCIG